VTLYTLTHPRRPVLPVFEAGAHVDLRLPDGRIRQYSLCGEPGERAAWQIAIKREDDGRGVSRWAHENLAVGGEVLVSAPRNNFSRPQGTKRVLMVAGGIGVTPLLAMAREMAAKGQDFVLHLAARSVAQAPLLAEVRAVCGARLVTWFGDKGRRFDPAVLGAPEDGVHIMACGPARLTDAVIFGAVGAGWPEGQLHAEHFQATADENFKPEPFRITLASTGATLLVPADRSALDVLREVGLSMPSSCELGICGACVCGYRDGIVIHRDKVLPVGSRQDRMTPCVSRARVGVTLDL
jgi:vanillate O-demethylase ferredoxin subunit